jgi:deazaflavin-dependent oxidoreductase (nitroreductase family)
VAAGQAAVPGDRRPTSRLRRRYRSLLISLGQRRLFSWLGPRVFAPLDTWLYPRLHGAVVSAGPPVLPMLLLTTTGRTSGRPRSVPLLYLERGDAFVVVGSNWGRAWHPGWTENLLANPCAVVQVGRRREDVNAHAATPAEKAELWPLLVELCPVWQTYATWSGRDLRVFVLRRGARATGG